MAKKVITNSVNIATLESKIVVDICNGTIVVDVTPSVWLGGGAGSVLGAKVKITNPFGVVIKDYGVSYDIAPPMIGNVSIGLPTQSGVYQYGTYTYEVELTDAGNVKTTVTDTIDICAPNRKNKTKLFGEIAAEITGSCKDGKVTIVVGEAPTYKGFLPESKTQTYTLTYPSQSLLPPLVTSISSFSVLLFEGVHKLVGDLCVIYNYGDNKYVKVPYKVNCTKNILCIVDLCTVFTHLESINAELNDSCSEAHKIEISNITIDALRLLKTIELGAACGEDVSVYIEQLEKLLGCKCSCGTLEGTPIVNNEPAKDFVITGCNVTKETVGLTDSYTINNYEYIVTVNPAVESFITVSSGVVDGCTVTQQLSFSVSALYTQIKAQVNNSTEYNFWASIINNTLNGLSAPLLLCLGYTTGAWDLLTFREKWIAVLTKLCSLNSGGNCSALVSANLSEAVLSTTLLSWVNNPDVFAVDIYVDNDFVDSVAYPSNSYSLTGFNNGVLHTYKLVAKCSTGIYGNTLTGTFTNAGCAFITPPSPSSSNITGATCPYDLTALLAAPPVGFTYEWHNANNTLNTSLITGTGVTSGVFFVFSKETATGCYSAGVQVTVVCAVAGNCTEPLSLLVSSAVGGNFISFSSAATPPPSYLVKRRLASDPDISGSYTVIGTPTFNVGTNKWEILDATASGNTLYVYMGESQCTDASRPNAQYTFAKLTCPEVTFSPITGTSIGYSFAHVGGSVDKYIVHLLDSSGASILQTKTHIAPFGGTVTDSFTGLSAATAYKIRVSVYIGSYSTVCSMSTVSTISLAARTLTVTYTEGQWNASLDAAFGTPLSIDGFVAGGSSGLTCDVRGESDEIVIPLTIPAGNLAALTSITGGLTVASAKYKIDNFGYINGAYMEHGDIQMIGGQQLTLHIAPIACIVYVP